MSGLRDLIKRLKDKLFTVETEKKRLAKIELKLGSMRRIVVSIRDNDPGEKERKELNQKLNQLQQR